MSSHPIELPRELWIEIILQLDLYDVLACRCVNHLFKTVVDDTAAIQYRIELMLHGLEDGPRSWRPGDDRTKLLRARETAWRDLSISRDLPQDEEIGTPSEEGPERLVRWSKHEYEGYGLCWDFYAGVLGQQRSPSSIEFVCLPSPSRGISEKRWNVMLDFEIADFTFDPAENILVVIQTPDTDQEHCVINMHLLRLYSEETDSSGVAHPLARHSLLSVRVPNIGPDSLSYDLQICGLHIAILIHDRGPPHGTGHAYLVAWDWVRGCRVLGAELSGSSSLQFIDPGTILVATRRIQTKESIFAQSQAVLEVYRCDSEAPGCPPDWESTPLSGHDDALDAQFMSHGQVAATFHLPAARRACMIKMLRMDPAPAWRPTGHVDAEPSPRSNIPFYTAPSHRIMNLHIQYRGQGRNQSSAVLFFRPDTILKRVSTMVPAISVPWRSWSDETRLCELSMDSNWPCYVYGTRFVRRSWDVTGMAQLEVMDFSPILAQQHVKKLSHVQDRPVPVDLPEKSPISWVLRSSKDSDETKWVLEPFEMPTINEFFSEPVRTCLPFYTGKAIIPGLSGRGTRAMMHEDGLMLVKADAGEHYEWLAL